MKWSIKYIVSALPFLFTACSGDWLDTGSLHFRDQR